VKRKVNQYTVLVKFRPRLIVFAERLSPPCSLLYTGGPKIYDVTKYLDDHPGGAEVMLDVAGTDADEFFEDIGHSKEAREELKKYLIGSLYLDAAALAKLKAEAEKKANSAAGGSNATLIVLLVAVLAIVMGYLQMNK
jgi:cytochrome-b5 reductase